MKHTNEILPGVIEEILKRVIDAEASHGKSDSGNDLRAERGGEADSQQGGQRTPAEAAPDPFTTHYRNNGEDSLRKTLL